MKDEYLSNFLSSYQWWSKLAMHALHNEQWETLGGRYIWHVWQYFNWRIWPVFISNIDLFSTVSDLPRRISSELGRERIPGSVKAVRKRQHRQNTTKIAGKMTTTGLRCLIKYGQLKYICKWKIRTDSSIYFSLSLLESKK